MTICHIPPSDSRVVLKMLCEGALRNIKTGSTEHNGIYFNQLINMLSWMQHNGGYPKNKDTVGTEDVNRIVMNAIFEHEIDLYWYSSIPPLLVKLNNPSPVLNDADERLKTLLMVFLKDVIEDLNKSIKG